MRKMFRLVGIATIGVGLGCGSALAHVSEVDQHLGSLSRALSPAAHDWIKLASVKVSSLEDPRKEEARREEPRREEPRGDREGGDVWKIEPPHEDEVPGPVSVVPEPDAWAMMIVGMAFLGLCARRRTRREKA